MKPEQLEIAQLKREVAKLKAERDILKGLLRERIDVKFGFIAKHRGVRCARSGEAKRHLGRALRREPPTAVLPRRCSDVDAAIRSCGNTEGSPVMGGKYAALMVAAGLTIFAASGAHADSSRIVKIRAALDAWLADRSLPEKATGVAAYISFGNIGPAIEAFAGKVGSGPQDAPVRQGTLFQDGQHVEVLHGGCDPEA
jgi:hypothetical protein